MKKMVAMTLMGAVLPLLAGCGSVVGAFVPPQTIDSPAGLTGAQLSSDDLQVESVRGTVNYSTGASTPPASFDDLKFPDNIPFNIRPHGLSFETGFASAKLSGSCLALAPDSFKVTLKSVNISVKDAASSASLDLSPTLVLTLTKTAPGSYTAAANKLSLSADAATTDAFIKVLTSGGKNDASFTARISADSNALLGCRMTFTLGSTSAVLSNFS